MGCCSTSNTLEQNETETTKKDMIQKERLTTESFVVVTYTKEENE